VKNKHTIHTIHDNMIGPTFRGRFVTKCTLMEAVTILLVRYLAPVQRIRNTPLWGPIGAGIIRLKATPSHMGRAELLERDSLLNIVFILGSHRGALVVGDQGVADLIEFLLPSVHFTFHFSLSFLL
jgi:hypothetical protein